MALPVESISIDEQSSKKDPLRALDYPVFSNNSSHIAYDHSRDEMHSVPNLFELIKEDEIKMEDYWGDEMKIKDEEMDYNGVVPELNYMAAQWDFENEDVDETMKDSSATFEVEKDQRSSRKVSRPLRFLDCDDLQNFNGGYKQTIKKSIVKSAKQSNKKHSDTIEKKNGPTRSKRISREITCPLCPYQTTSAGSLTHHLRYAHFTTLGLAGLALRCDCGVETLSDKHTNKCDIANFIVVRKRDGPIQTFYAKTTPQCVLCEVYPKTAYGYALHLKIHHESVLRANGIWLLCSCGAKYRNECPDSKHAKECTRREFTLHKVTSE